MVHAKARGSGVISLPVWDAVRCMPPGRAGVPTLLHLHRALPLPSTAAMASLQDHCPSPPARMA